MELISLFYWKQHHTLYLQCDGILSYDELFKMLNYNNIFTHKYIILKGNQL